MALAPAVCKTGAIFGSFAMFEKGVLNGDIAPKLGMLIAPGPVLESPRANGESSIFPALKNRDSEMSNFIIFL
jgi:hypothetical protein